MEKVLTNHRTKNREKRVPFYDIPAIAGKGRIRTFQKDTYNIKGITAKNRETGESVRLSDLYYEIRTVQDQKGEVVARRKNPLEELILANVE